MNNLVESWKAEIEQALQDLKGSSPLGYTGGGEPVLPKKKQLERHCFILGAPGSGKSRLMALLAKAHLQEGHTLIVLDPHGTKPDSLYQLTLAEALDQGLEDELLCLDPSDEQYTIKWNPTSRNGLPVATQSEYLLEAINKACKDFLEPESRPQHERWLLNTLEYLIYKGKPLIDSLDTLRGVDDFTEIEESAILREEWDYYRRQRVKRRDELTESVFNRMRRILASPALQDIFSQREATFNLAELIKEPRIILCNLGSSARLSRRASTLLGSLILAELLMALEQRASREPHLAIIADEASRFLTPDLGIALAELRGYGCSMTLACQSLSQLADKEREILETCLACCETIITFRLGDEDSARLARQCLRYDPYLLKDEILSTKFEPVLKRVTLGTVSRGKTSSENRSYPEGDLAKGVISGGETYSEVETCSEGYVTENIPFEEVSSRTYFSLEEQLRILSEKIRDLPDRQAMIKDNQGVKLFEVAKVADAEFSKEELKALSKRLFSKSHYYVKIEKIKAEQLQLQRQRELTQKKITIE